MEVFAFENPALFDGYLDYFSVRPKGFPLPRRLQTLRPQDVYISPFGRLCSMKKAVSLESEELARSFADFLLPSMKQRYGAHLQLVVVTWTEISPDAEDYARVNLHSTVVRKLIGARA